MPNSARRFVVGAAVALLFPALIVGCAGRKPADRTADLTPPAAPREFRAAWVATVGNIDWPTKRGLSTEQQRAEMEAILDRCAELQLNAVVLQVRTSCDAFYPSDLEPWSVYLTGEQGKAPEPFYDPLKEWIDGAHRRGIELHAWFNPYRAKTPGARSPNSPTHISQTNPAIVKSFGGYEWLDPGEQAAQDLTYNVFLDVVRRYDVDGIHIDDYFYPYKDYLTDRETKKVADFPDEPSWQRYVDGGGTLSRGDWRRDNVNRLIERIYNGIKREKPHVHFGISPFGIARAGVPSTVRPGFDQYEELYADAKLWWNKGWCDYFTPQLYWSIDSTQPFRDLVEWYTDENLKGRHLWPGLFTSLVGAESGRTYAPGEVVDQIGVIRDTPGATGHVHFSMKALMPDWGRRGRERRSAPGTEPSTNASTTSPSSPTTAPSDPPGSRDVLSAKLATVSYAEPALVPASPWLDNKRPASPSFSATQNGDAVNVSWAPRGKEPARVYAVYAKHNAGWRLHLVPFGQQELRLAPDAVMGPVTAVAVRSVDRMGNESKPTKAVKPKKAAANEK